MPHDNAAAPFHYVEYRPDHGRVFAEQERAGREREKRVERHEPAVLSRHVMSSWRDGTERRPSDHELRATESHQVGEIRVTTSKLPRGHLASKVEARNAVWREVPTQVGGERRPIQLFGRPNVAHVALHKDGPKPRLRARGARPVYAALIPL